MSVLKLYCVNNWKQATGIFIRAVLILLWLPLFANDAVWRKGDSLPGFKSFPNIKGVVASVKVCDVSGVYSYDFVVFNPQKNQFPVVGFEVDLRDNPLEHSFAHDDLTVNHRLVEHRKILGDAKKVPVFAVKVPPGWVMSSADDNEEAFDGGWSVRELDQQLFIEPGKSKGGFSLNSKAPPGIREFLAGAWSYEFDYGIDKLSPEQFNFYYNSDEYRVERSKGITCLGKTIAPVAPPEPFTVSSWTIRMAEYAVEARKQKWIEGDKNLAEIKKMISELNSTEVAEIRIVVKKIEDYVLAEKKKGNLTDEADALLRLNAQYLLRRLEIK